MKKSLEILQIKWKKTIKLKKVAIFLGSVIGIIFILRIILKIYREIEKIWSNNSDIILGFFLLVIYLYPLLYSFFSEVRSKDKELMEIIKKDDTEEIEKELTAFHYYTLPHFVADISKQFSSLWIFIFVQVLFNGISELVNEESKAMMYVYRNIILLSLIICFASFTIGKCFSIAIIITSRITDRHVRYILEIREILIKK